MKILLNSIKEMEEFADVFTKDLSRRGKMSDATIVGLQGNLGAGKTTFVKSVASALGVEGAITSPTFVIEKIYRLPDGGQFSRLVHIDAYRLENGKELLSLGWKEISSDSQNLIFIEWPERVANILPKDVHRMYFSFIDENTREVEY